MVHEKKEARQYLNSTSVHDLWTLYRFIRYYKTNNGTSLAEPFLDLPLKKELPDYYLGEHTDSEIWKFISDVYGQRQTKTVSYKGSDKLVMY